MGIMVNIVMTPCGEFWGRKWNLLDIVTAVVFFSLHCLCVMAPFHFTWPAFWVACALYLVTGLGVTLSFLEILLTRAFVFRNGSSTCLPTSGFSHFREPIEWVSSHRYHHQFTDTEKDVHSPLQGFWFSHMGWILDSGSRFGKYGGLKNVEDLKRQPFYRFLHRTFLLHSVVLLGSLLYVVGGFPFLAWGLGVRMVCVFHSTLLVNSAGHIWGKQVYLTGDMSRNNWWLGLFALGEGWHNNHHAFDFSARQGFEWWQIDVTWYVIRFLQAIGLATNVKTPTEAQKRRKALHNKVTAAEN
ncbi:hypothetical protein L3X38_024969 [Prunus dulcis]|uniref:Fatty acid desaturase domain-containing protein n=1 Tax=Prunus dulcis TaxID=3755 RepID=A0AAD4Z6X0_PRUDU|nr:hypothetical protein L3X38_024969 [Prunus dulcis]